MDFPHGAMLTVRRKVETKNELGDTTTVVTALPWGPCAVAPRYARETSSPNVAPIVVGKEIYGPPIALTADDEILIGDEVWKVDGQAADFTGASANPFTGWAPGIAVPVKRASAR